MTLVLAIKCITPSSASKDYIFKIGSLSTKALMEIQNQFVHNYEYVYKLWPCKPGQTHIITIEFIQKMEQGEKLRGKVQGKIICSYEGDVFRMHGAEEDDETILMKFIIEKQSEQMELEEKELIRINKQMQQNLIKYRKQIRGYQQFLYFTNNVIKELNQDPKEQRQDFVQESIQVDKLPNINKTQEKSNYSRQKSMKQSLINTEKLFTRKEEKKMISAEQQMKQSFRSNFPSQIIQSQRPKESIVKEEQKIQQSKRGSQVKTFLNKYPYLQLELDKSQKTQQNRDSGKNTPISKLKEEDDQILETKAKRSNEISISIKKRRQQYFIPKQTNLQNQRQSLATKSITSTNKDKIYENKKFHISSLEVNIDKPLNIPEVNNNPQGKSTRSQTGLKEMTNANSKHFFQEKPSQHINTVDSAIEIIPKQHLQQSNHIEQIKPMAKSIHSVKKSVLYKQQNKKSFSQRQKSNRQSINKISRRKKIVKKDNDTSARYTTQQIKPIFATQPFVLTKQNLIDKLTIFNIQSLFYTNFRSSVKKCIIEHNHQIYQTQHQENNLKETSWAHERITLNPISPFESIIFQIYSLKRQKMELQGSSIINIRQILTSKEYSFKYYLYFDDIAVGYIKFSTQKQEKSNKRLTVSLPQIKEKSTICDYGPKTSKTAKINQFSTTQVSYPINKRMQQSLINKLQEGEQENQLSYDDLTSKIRNLKMQRKNRLN